MVTLKKLRRIARKLNDPDSWSDEVDDSRPRCMHSDFPGNSKQRRQMRRWHRKNNPTCNDTLMDNLRLGRECIG